MKRHFFAPGALDRCEHMPRRSARKDAGKSTDSLGLFILVLCIVAALSACVGMVAGYIEWATFYGGVR